MKGKEITIQEVTAFVCSGCSLLYEHQESAQACCEPNTVRAFKCPICDNLYDNLAGAYGCYITENNPIEGRKSE